MNAKSEKHNDNQYTNYYGYKCHLEKNINFLQHLIDCLQGRKDIEIINNTIKQLQVMIKNEKDKIKRKEENGKL